MPQHIGFSKDSVSTGKNAKVSRPEVPPLARIKVMVTPFCQIFAFPASNLSYIAFSNNVIIFPVVTSPGGFTCPPYNPQSPASRSINCKLWLAHHSQNMAPRNTIGGEGE